MRCTFAIIVGLAVSSCLLWDNKVTMVDATIPLFQGNTTTARMPVGTNLGVVLSEGTYCPWTNLIKCAEPWQIKRARDMAYVDWKKEGITFGTEGYPVGFDQESYPYAVVARSWVHAKLQGRYPGGSYKLTHTGSGTVTVSGDAALTSTTSGSMTFSVTPSHTGIWIYINQSSPTDPVKGMVLVQSSLEATVSQPNHYNPTWLSLLSNFDTLRTAWWQKEKNDGYVTPYEHNWADRKSNSYFTFAGHSTKDGAPFPGVSHEEIVNLAKVTGKNLWVSIPQFATDQYVFDLARFYATQLGTTSDSTKVFVEQSNKVGWQGDVTPRIAKMKMYFQAFEAAYGAGSDRFQILISCDLLCDEFTKYLTPTNPKYDPQFRKSIAAIALPGYTMAGAEPWTEEQPNPYFLERESFINDTYRLAREKMFYDETKYIEQLGKWALLNITVYAKDGGVALMVEHYGHRFRRPNHTVARLEGYVEQAMWKYEVNNDPGLKFLWAEWLQRWYRMGGGLFIAGQPLYPGANCVHTANNESIQGLDRDHCNYPALVRYIDEGSSSNKLAGVKSFIEGDPLGSALMASDGAPPAPKCTVQCVWGVCVDGSCMCDAGYSGDDCSVFSQESVPNNCMPDDYGMNLGGTADWSPVWWWSDFMKFSRQWVHQPISQPDTDFYGWIWSYYDERNKNEYNPYSFPTLDNNGYPLSLEPNDALATFQRRDTYEYPHGRFHVFYDGDGTLTFGMDTHVVRRVRPGYIIVETKPVRQLNNGLFFQIRRTNPDDHLRNVRVIPEAQLKTYHNDPFHPLLIKQLQEYKVLRFMSVQNVGGTGTCLSHLQCDENQNSTNINRTWSQRTKPSYYSQVAGLDGMSIEYIVQLSNRLHIKPWISVPFNADDDYILQQATYIKNNLNPKLKPIIEYSNEVWANHHYVGFYAQDMGVKYYPGTGADVVAARACWNQRRARQVWKIYNTVGVSITRVLAGQSVASRVLREALTCEKKFGTGIDIDWSQQVDQISVAPYLSRDLVGPRGILSLEEVFLDMGGTLNATAEWISEHKALADEFRIQELTLYEAGPAFFGGAQAEDPDVVTLGRLIHRDRRIRQLQIDYFSKLREAGAGLVGYFMGPASQWSKYGAFGIRQYMNEDETTSYKYLGYRDWAMMLTKPSSCSVPEPQHSCPGADKNCNGRGFCMPQDNTCICYNGWTSSDCSQQWLIPDTTQCNRYTCAPKGGSCQPTAQLNHFQFYTCVGCDAGWTGWHCQVPVCDSNCSWNGKCTAPGVCTCYRGYAGKRCEIDCGCGGHGDCSADNTTCTCDTNYALREPSVAASARTSAKNTSPNQVCLPTCGSAKECLAPGVKSCEKRCVFGSCWDGLCKCWSGFGGDRCHLKAPSNSSNKDSTMGINLAGIADWTASQVFLNMMFRTRKWFLNPAGIDAPSTRWTVNEPLTLTRDGYPAFLPRDRVAGTFATRDTYNQDTGRQYIPAGDYIMMYDGDGRIETGMDAKILEETRSKGFMKVRYTPTRVLDNGFYIRIEATDPQNPIRNIRIYSPSYPHEAYARTFVFHPDIYDELKNFRSIRFMNWVGLGQEFPDPTENIRDWKDRKLPNDASMATWPGVAEEHMITLCNWMNAEPWFTIPHDASDDYVEKFAKLIRLRLRPDVAIHIEHSNEVWNSHYESWKYAAARGQTHFGSQHSKFEAANLWHGKRSQEIFALFARVFGPIQFSRLKFKLGTFVLIPSWTRQSLSQVTMRPLNLAVTTYFCGEGTFGGEVRASTLSTSQLVNECLNASLSGSMSHLEAQKALAAEHGLGLDSYEGGPALVQQRVLSGGFARYGQAQTYHSLHTSQTMKQIIPNFLNRHQEEAGVDLEMYFTSSSRPSIYGSWGIKDSIHDSCTSSPKCSAVNKWIGDHKNKTKRTITWGLPEYGAANNVVKVMLNGEPSFDDIATTASALEKSLGLPLGSIVASFNNSATGNKDSTTITTSRAFKAQGTGERSKEVLFIVKIQQNDDSVRTENTTARVREELAKADTKIGATAVESVDEISIDGAKQIDPHASLPAELLDSSAPTQVPLVRIPTVADLAPPPQRLSTTLAPNEDLRMTGEISSTAIQGRGPASAPANVSSQCSGDCVAGIVVGVLIVFIAGVAIFAIAVRRKQSETPAGDEAMMTREFPLSASLLDEGPMHSGQSGQASPRELHFDDI